MEIPISAVIEQHLIAAGTTDVPVGIERQEPSMKAQQAIPSDEIGIGPRAGTGEAR
jgi:hypothetical protein